jgi:tetratricopeptide (TPR) repeat protein
MFRSSIFVLAILVGSTLLTFSQSIPDGTFSLAGSVKRSQPTASFTGPTAEPVGVSRSVGSDAYVANNLAAGYFKEGRRDEAIELLKQATVAKPDVWNFQLNLSVALASTGDLDAALPYARRAAELADNHTAQEELCTVLYQLKDSDATRCFELLLKYPEADNYDRVGYAGALILDKQVKAAEPILREVIASEPRFSAAYNSLGVDLFLQGRWKEAANAFRDAVSLDPDAAEPRVNLGLALLRLGDRDAAIGQYRFLKTMSPAFAEQLYRRIFAGQIIYAPGNK